VDALEGYLKVLAYANRLELLSLLREPRTLEEIHLAPGRGRAGGSPERPISRQAVQGHLDRLVELGIVRARRVERRDRGAHVEYLLDQSRIFAVTEELRKLSALQSRGVVDAFATIAAPGEEEVRWEPGPKLVLVHGVEEGRAFPLRRADVRSPRGWIVGRAPEAHVRLQYDPYVSTENAEVLLSNGAWRLLDLRTARNGTYLNWRRLPLGGEAALQPGDVIGVGRSLLVFRPE